MILLTNDLLPNNQSSNSTHRRNSRRINRTAHLIWASGTAQHQLVISQRPRGNHRGTTELKTNMLNSRWHMIIHKACTNNTSGSHLTRTHQRRRRLRGVQPNTPSATVAQ